MPVTKESELGEAKKADQTQDDKSPAVEQPPEEKIPEKKEASETKELLPQEDANVSKEKICTLSVKRKTDAGDDVGVVEKSEMTDSSIVRSEISITVTDAPSESQQSEGTIETEYLSPSGDGGISPDITTSSLSLCTQSEQCTELDTQSAQGSSLQCRNCKNMYTSSEDKSASCSGLCPFCTATTNSPLRPRIPQIPGNPVKNRNIDTQLDAESQSEDETQDPVVVGGVEEPESPPSSSSLSTGSPPNASSPLPGVDQQQSDSTQSGETRSGEIRQDPRGNNLRFNCACHPSLQIIISIIAGFIILIIVMGLTAHFGFPLTNSSSQNSSKP